VKGFFKKMFKNKKREEEKKKGQGLEVKHHSMAVNPKKKLSF